MAAGNLRFVDSIDAGKTSDQELATHTSANAVIRTCAGFLLAIIALLLSAAISPTALAQGAETEPTAQHDDAVTALFSEYDPDSTIELNHAIWSDFLSKTVVFAGPSTQRISRGQKRAWIGSKMRFGNDLPSRYENNRVMLSGFDEDHLAALREYRQALEAVPDQLPLARLNRAEQLAYWLNLYNAHALEHVAAHSSAETTEALRSAPGEEPDGVWHERTLKVAGIPLSLVDIEQKIVFPIWDDPLVLYGLWQGAIGGPRLPLQAYTGSNVWRMLRDNAVEFVNSNRGMKPAGKALEVSVIYGWGAPLFDGEEHLRNHISSLARPPFSDGLAATRRVEIGLYDAHLADLSGGTHHRGQWNHTAAFMAGIGGNYGNFWANLASRTDTTHRAMPAATIELVRGMARFNQRERHPTVTIRDCPEGSDCAAPTDDSDGDDDGEADENKSSESSEPGG